MTILEEIFLKEFEEKVTDSQALSGGDINEVFLVNDRVVKINDAKSYPQMLEKEARGLQALRETNSILIPEVFAFGEIDGKQYLILEKIGKGLRDQAYWESIASGLANMHQSSCDQFGWNEDNYIGYLPQSNDWHERWTEFFIHCRMEPLVKMAFNDRKLRSENLRQFERMYLELESIFPNENPSLLHGDLWGGNLMEGLIDPAVYFGHREMDLAMTQMFGGFSSNFIDLYDQYAPLEPGIDARIPVYNLYPNLTHLNMFGSSYLFGIESVIRRF
ncbi:MAG: fructosamine kinase family protein [Crocinitomicaceae bacterium]